MIVVWRHSLRIVTSLLIVKRGLYFNAWKYARYCTVYSTTVHATSAIKYNTVQNNSVYNVRLAAIIITTLSDICFSLAGPLYGGQQITPTM